MTNLPPPNPRSSRRNSLGFNELVGIVVAFGTIGTILFWSLTRGESGFGLGDLQSPATSILPQPSDIPTPSSTTALPVDPSIQERSVETQPRNVGPRNVGPRRVGAIRFSDVPDDFWAAPFITALGARGVISGFRDGTFKPNQLVTRAEYATMLQEAFDRKNPVRNAVSFKDVPASYWAASAIQKAYTVGFLKGYPNNSYQPEEEIPRVQALVALANGLGLKPQDSPEQTLQAYEDATQVPRYAADEVAAATEAGLVVNYPEPKTLNPNQRATRADVAGFIYQALVKGGQANRIESEYVVQPEGG
ncbi:MAG TPA: S-layer homology domain-containing protein [Candidatus Caenarcaniphilales bacterium]